MHMRRQIATAVAARLEGIPGVKGEVRRKAEFGNLDDRSLPFVSVFGEEDLRPEVLNQGRGDSRPTRRGFRAVVAVVASREQWEDGLVDGLCEIIETRLLADDDNPIRDLATMGVEYGGGLPIAGEGEEAIYAFAGLWEFYVPMREGAPGRKG